MTRSLDGAVFAVVGGYGGLGSPIAAELERRGATVLRTSRSPRDADTVLLDIRDADAGDVLVAAARERHGHLDGVVVASGIVAFGDLAATDDVTTEELFLTNALGPLWLARHVAPGLAERRGVLAVITGVVAEQPLPGMVPYAASKAALSAGLTGLRRELRRHGVHVLDARPPHTETGLATRPLAGSAPRLPPGLDPADVAARIVDAIEADEPEVAAAGFG
jgi:cyclic-di-GMP-binding biofilm dispersal mediator protein